jgi:hypothetical protein
VFSQSKIWHFEQFLLRRQLGRVPQNWFDLAVLPIFLFVFLAGRAIKDYERTSTLAGQIGLLHLALPSARSDTFQNSTERSGRDVRSLSLVHLR